MTKDYEIAHESARKLKVITADIRVKVAHAFRKKQESLWKSATQKWSLMGLQVNATWADASQDRLDQLKQAKSLMLRELAELQKTFRFQKSDIDLIFQSVSMGISLTEQSKAYEFLQENLNRTEGLLRFFVDWNQRVSAILC